MYLTNAIDKITNQSYGWLCSFSLMLSMIIMRYFQINDIDLYLGVGMTIFLMFNVWTILAGLVHIFVLTDKNKKGRR